MSAGEQDLEAINRALARLLRRHASRSAFARSAAAAGVGLAQPAYLLLRTVIEDGPVAMSRLADAVHMDPGTAARQVARLVDAGMVERRPDTTDGRVCLVAGTAAGESAGRALTEVRMRHLHASLSGWSETDLHAFAGLLARFVEDMATTGYARPADAQESGRSDS